MAMMQMPPMPQTSVAVNSADTSRAIVEAANISRACKKGEIFCPNCNKPTFYEAKKALSSF